MSLSVILRFIIINTSQLPLLTGLGPVKICFCASWLQCIALYINSNRLICKSLVDLYLNVIHKLLPVEQISVGGFSLPQNLPTSSLEHAGPSLISINDPKQVGNANVSSVSLTLKPSSADIIHVHCLSEPQIAGLFELVMNRDVLLAGRMTGLPAKNNNENKIVAVFQELVTDFSRGWSFQSKNTVESCFLQPPRERSLPRHIPGAMTGNDF